MAVCILRVKSRLNYSNSILIDEVQLDMMVNRKVSYLSEEPFLHSRSQSMSTVSKYHGCFFKFKTLKVIFNAVLCILLKLNLNLLYI